MNILVCFKIVPDWDGVLEVDWANYCGGGRLDFDYVKRVCNCFDDSALEIGLRLKEAAGGRCTAVTVGSAPSSSFWKALYAAGFDDVAVIGGEGAESFEWEFQPLAVAKELARFAANKAFDLILTGKQAGAADSGAVPFFLAELLDTPVAYDIETVEYAARPYAVSITRETAAGRERSTASLPLVAAVGDSPLALRAVTLRARLAAGEKLLTRLPAQAPVSTTELFREERAGNCDFWEGGVSDMARKVIDLCVQ